MVFCRLTYIYMNNVSMNQIANEKKKKKEKLGLYYFLVEHMRL